MERTGSLTVICGPMFAGKTTKLLSYITNEEDCVVVKPSCDGRYSQTEVVTHDGKRVPCYVVEDTEENEILRFTDTKKKVLIDEVQFMSGLILYSIQFLLKNGVDVVVAGLDTNYRDEPFHIMGELMCIADRIIKLTSICIKCGDSATKTYMKDATKPYAFRIGGSELYEPMCPTCYNKYSKKGVDFSEND